MQALLLERIHELEAQLKKTADSEQAKVAQLARLEGRAAVAEGSLKAAEQQLSQALSELQAQRAKVRRPAWRRLALLLGAPCPRIPANSSGARPSATTP